MPITTETQAQVKAHQLLGSPPYFQPTITKLQPAMGEIQPQWIVSAMIGKLKGTSHACIMFPQDMEPVPDPPPPGSFDAKLRDIKNEMKRIIDLIEQGVPKSPSDIWWHSMNNKFYLLRADLKTVWEDKFPGGLW